MYSACNSAVAHLLSGVRDGPVEADLVAHQLVEPVDSLQSLLLVLLLHPQLVRLPRLSRSRPAPVLLSRPFS